MSESTDPETRVCPWCSEHRLIVPHPSEPDREIAQCICMGDLRPFYDRPRTFPRQKTAGFARKTKRKAPIQDDGANGE